MERPTGYVKIAKLAIKMMMPHEKLIFSLANCWFYRRVYEICVPPKWLCPNFNNKKKWGSLARKL
jgi:hypothetical protein